MQVEIYKGVESPIKKEQVARLVRTALRVLKKDSLVSISVAIVGAKTGRKLNRLYRGVDSVPSVLSFEEVRTKKKESLFILPRQKEKYIGEIIISDPVVKARAKESGKTYSKEFDYLFIHGFMHLMGYTHKQSKKAKLMEEQETRILKLLAVD
jgi:probable rRNA maturation factor